jgi:hypothetical protein
MNKQTILSFVLIFVMFLSPHWIAQSNSIDNTKNMLELNPDQGFEMDIPTQSFDFDTPTRNTPELAKESKDLNFAERGSLDKEFEDKTGKEIIFSSEIIELKKQASKGVNLADEIYILIFDSHESIPKDYLADYSYETLTELPIVVVEASGNDVYHLSDTPSLDSIFVNRYYQFIDPNWIETGHNYEQNFETQSYPSRAQVGAKGLIDAGLTGEGAIIAILDTGIDSTHPDLDDLDNDPSTNDPKVIKEKSFIDYNYDGIADSDPADVQGHGTHCAGIAAGIGNINGIAPGAFLFNGKVLDDYGGGDFLWIANGVNWAVEEGADVISMSIGGLYGDVQMYMNKIVDAAAMTGAQVVVAAGNSGPSQGTISSPALADFALAVAASDYYTNVVDFSSRGPSVLGDIGPDILAPGAEIISSLPGNSYGVYSGTSMATPAVAGGLALLLAEFSGLEPALVRGALLDTASDRDYHPFEQGAGLMNLADAYTMLNSGDALNIIHPKINSDHPLLLSSGETMILPIDMFTTGTNIPTLSTSLSGVTFSSTFEVDTHWYRSLATITMGNANQNGTISLTQDNSVKTSVNFYLALDEIQNDGSQNTDAGETFTGALTLAMNSSLKGSLDTKDTIDYYNFTAQEGAVYEIIAGNLTSDYDMFVHDSNGSVISWSGNWDLWDEMAYIYAFSSGEYSVRIFHMGWGGPGSYDLSVEKVDTFEIGDDLSSDGVLTGNYSTSTLDVDNDNLIDSLVFEVEIELDQQTELEFGYSVSMARDDYQEGYYWVSNNWVYNEYEAGTHTVELSIETEGLAFSNYDGAYVLDSLIIYDWNNGDMVNSETSLIETPSYDSNSFDKKGISTFEVSYEAVDTDNDNVPEEWHMKINYKQNYDGYMWLDVYYGNVYGTVGYSWDTIDFEVVANQEVELIFEVPLVDLVGKANASLLGFVLSDMWEVIPRYEQFDQSYLETFDISESSDASIDVEAVDTDDSGLFDVMRFTFEFSFDEETYMDLIVSFAYSITNETALPYSHYDYGYYEAGDYQITVDYPITLFTSKGLQFPILFPFVGGYSWEGEFGGPMVVNGYTLDQFDVSPVKFVNLDTTELVVQNEGSLDIFYEVDLEFYSTKAFTAFVMADLQVYQHEEGGYPYVDGLWIEHDFTIGQNIIPLKINGQNIFSSKFIGSMEVSTIQVWTEEYYEDEDMYYAEQEVYEFVYRAGIVDNISWKDIEPYAPVSISSYELSPSYNDDNLITNVDFKFTVDIRSAATYFYEFHPGIWSEDFFKSEELQVGEKDIIFSIDSNMLARAIMNSWGTPSFGFSIMMENEYLDYHDTMWGDFLRDIIPYTLDDLDYVLPLELTDITASLSDPDQDDLFEEMTADLTLAVNEIGYYDLNFEFSLLIDTNEGYQWEWYFSSYQYFEFDSTGNQDSSISYPLRDLNWVIEYIEEGGDEISSLTFVLTQIGGWDEIGQLVLLSEPKELLVVNDLSSIDFSPPIKFNDLSSTLKDDNSDGLYDYIDINLDLDVSVAGYYYISLNMDMVITLSNGEKFYWWANGAYAEAELEIGSTPFNLQYGFSELGWVIDDIESWYEGETIETIEYLVYSINGYDDIGYFNIFDSWEEPISLAIIDDLSLIDYSLPLQLLGIELIFMDYDNDTIADSFMIEIVFSAKMDMELWGYMEMGLYDMENEVELMYDYYNFEMSVEAGEHSMEMEMMFEDMGLDPTDSDMPESLMLMIYFDMYSPDLGMGMGEFFEIEITPEDFIVLPVIDTSDPVDTNSTETSTPIPTEIPSELTNVSLPVDTEGFSLSIMSPLVVISSILAVGIIQRRRMQ